MAAASPLAASPSESHRSAVLRSLFVYGPLMAEEAITALLGRVPPSRPAKLFGYTRCCQKGSEEASGVCSTHRSLVRLGYPAVAAAGKGYVVEGILLERLRPQEMQALDFYEDDNFKREVVKVVAASGFGGEEELESLAYIWPPAGVVTLDPTIPWSYTNFRTQHMKRFIESVVKPCRKAFENHEGVLEAQMSLGTARSTARS